MLDVKVTNKVESELLEKFFDKIRKANEDKRLRETFIQSQDVLTTDGSFIIPGQELIKKVTVSFTFIEE